MPRYIDADDAIYELERAFPIDDYGKIIRCISRTPTADVVKAVRCKECKWHSKLCGEGFCSNFSITGFENDDYCSYGERRKDE